MIILDIDNCIADDGWRIRFIDWRATDPMRRYHAYHLLSPHDAVGNQEIFVGRPALVLTSRPVSYRRITCEWLHFAGVQVRELLMRNDSDHRPSLAVKRAQVGWLASCYDVPLASISCAYDDRQEIVDMYLEMGIRAERRWIHDICSYTNPFTGINHVDGSKNEAIQQA